MTQQQLVQLKIAACKVRMGVVESTFHAKAGHPGGSLSAADAITYLYFAALHIDPQNPQMPNRDRFVLSKGHAAPALYAALAHRGFFPPEQLASLRQVGSFLQGHPNMNTVPGVDMSTGSLGQGVSAAAGMALAAKAKGQADIRVFALLGDGETQEGQVWEACMFAAHYKLDNLCILVDNNGLQIDGPVAQVLNVGELAEKLTAFGLQVCTIDGHDFAALESAIASQTQGGKPKAIVLKTTKGKGVSYMENAVEWHGKAPNAQEYTQAMRELQAQLAEWEAQA